MTTIATSLDQAAAATGEFRAGGTDVQQRIRTGIAGPDIVDISRIPGLDGITWNPSGGCSIGAMFTVADIARDAKLQSGYGALTATAGGLATPQIREAATLGGNLLQRSRCWYFRNPHFQCVKRGGEGCPAREGQHLYSVVFESGPCISPHPSSIAVALLAYGASYTTSKHASRPIETLYNKRDATRDHQLEEGEILTSVELPAPVEGERTAYFRAISRFEAEWPLIEVAVRLLVEGDRISFARVAVGAAMSYPVRLAEVEDRLIGNGTSGEALNEAARMSMSRGMPLPQTRYKVNLLAETIREALERAAR